MKNKKNHTNILIIIVAIIFVISLIAAIIILLNKDDKKDDNNTKTTSSTITTTKESNEEGTTSSTNTTKGTTTIKNSSSTSKKTTTVKTTANKNCNIEELEAIAEKNKPDKYAVWKTKPTFNVPSGIEYGIGYQKFFWMWYQIGTKNGEPDYIWVVASDKESGSGYPKGEGNTIHEINPSGHFKNAMKFMIAKPTTDGTKPGERRGEVSLYYYTGVTSILCS